MPLKLNFLQVVQIIMQSIIIPNLISVFYSQDVLNKLNSFLMKDGPTLSAYNYSDYVWSTLCLTSS